MITLLSCTQICPHNTGCDVKARVNDLQMNRYKIIVLVHIGELRDQGRRSVDAYDFYFFIYLDTGRQGQSKGSSDEPLQDHCLSSYRRTKGSRSEDQQ